MSCDVFVVGALHLDVIVNAPAFPRLDETLQGTSVAYAFGGKGGNQAVALAKMGAQVAMAGRIGQDGFADQIEATLKHAGVDHRQVLRQPGASGMSVAIVDDAGDYGAVIVSAANLDIDPDDIVIPEGTKLICLQNEISESVNIALARAAHALGIAVMLNAAPARSVTAGTEALYHTLIVNRIEALDMTGEGEAGQAALALRACGYERVLVTLGGEGVVVAEGESVTHHPSHSVQVVSTHGAGDAFVGAFAARVCEGDTTDQAVAFAQAAAALHVCCPVDARDQITVKAVRAFQRGEDKR
jgi:ribokinase